jgi:ferric-chelate reductase
MTRPPPSSATTTTATTARMAATSKATTTSSASTLNPETLVFHLDILLVAIIGAFILFRLPRALARLSTPLEWTNGHFLRHSTASCPSHTELVLSKKAPRTTDQSFSFSGIPSEHGLDFTSNYSHSLFAEGYVAHRRKYSKRSSRKANAYPAHVQASPAFALPFLPILRHRIAPGFSVGQIIVLSGYFAVLLYATLSDSNPFTDPLRAGWVAVSQLPLVFAFAAKNSIVGILLGLSYEKASCVCEWLFRFH